MWGGASRARMRAGPARSRGFTLIEVMMTVVIIGILAAIAYPAYQDQVRKSRRSDAKSVLLDAANRQEQFILDHVAYTTNMRDLGFSADPATSQDGYYTFDAVAGACGAIARCYTLTASPVAGKAQAYDTKCTSFSVASTGARTATGSTAGDCW